jgi:plastocyanin
MFVAVLFVACKDPKPEQSSVLPPQESATDSATHPASPGGTAVVPEVDSGTTVLAVVTEGSIAVRGQTIPPGPAVVTVENGGKETHNLFIEGEGISRAAGDNIAAGATQTVDVIFKPGTYTFYCPVMNHRDLGEQIQVTVSTDATTDTAASTTTSATGS